MVRLSAEIDVNGTTYEIADSLTDISFSGQDRSDTSLPSWGIKSNSGSLEMYDSDGSIEKLSAQGLLENSAINIYLNVGNRKEQIGGFYVANANQNRQTKKTKIEFQDVLLSWQDRQMRRFIAPDITNPPLSYVLSIVKAITGISVEYADSVTKTWIENTKIVIPVLEAGTAWAQMAKICEVSCCYIYCDNKGVPVIHYSRGT